MSPRPQSPFPGMDPYLEDPSLWPNVHQSLITYARDALQVQLGTRYYCSIGERVYLETPDRSVVPDVLVTERGGPRRTAPSLQADAPVVLVLEQVERREVFIEIQDPGSGNRVITVIEVLSPSNKYTGVGRELYVRKQAELLASSVHLVEIDLLRAGSPTVAVLPLRSHSTPYRVVVSRASDRLRRELYPITLRQRLPLVAVPLAAPDADAVLDLQAVLAEACSKGAYGLRVSYAGAPDPPLSPDDAAWAREVAAKSPD